MIRSIFMAIAIMSGVIALAFPASASNPNISCVQEKLAEEGFYTSAVDGLNGPGTRGAAEGYFGSKGAPDLPDPGKGGESFDAEMARKWCHIISPKDTTDDPPFTQECGLSYYAVQKGGSYDFADKSPGKYMFDDDAYKRLGFRPSGQGMELVSAQGTTQLFSAKAFPLAGEIIAGLTEQLPPSWRLLAQDFAEQYTYEFQGEDGPVTIVFLPIHIPAPEANFDAGAVLGIERGPNIDGGWLYSFVFGLDCF